MATTTFTNGTTITSTFLNDIQNAEHITYSPPLNLSSNRTLESKLADIVSVKDFGAVGDGTTDDTTALTNAFAYCSTNHTTLYFPPGVYTTTAQLNVTSGFKIVGTDQGSAQATASFPTFACSIKWTGSSVSSEYIIAVKASTSANWVMGFGLTDIALDGQNSAYGCLHLTCIRYSQLGTIWVRNGREYNVLIDDNNGSIICGQSDIDTIHSRHTTGLGVVLRSNGGAGLTQMNIRKISGGDFEIGDCDSSIFDHVQTDNLIFRGTGSEGNPKASRKNKIGWFAGGAVTAEDGSKNIIEWLNSEGTTVTIDSGASLHYSIIDRNNGLRYTTDSFLISDKYVLEPQLGVAHTGSPTYGTIGAAGYSLILFDDAATETWKWTFILPRRWRIGKITGFELLCAPASAGGGNVVLQAGALFRTLTNAFGTGPTLEDFTVAASSTSVLETVTLTLATPIATTGIADTDVGDDWICMIRIGRDGASGSDTLVGDYGIFGVRVLWEGDARSEGTAYRYDPSPDISTPT